MKPSVRRRAAAVLATGAILAFAVPVAAQEAPETASDLTARAIAALRAGRASASGTANAVEEAEALLREALALDGAPSSAAWLMAAILAGQGREAEARSLLAAHGDLESALAGYRELLDRLPGAALLEAQAARVTLALGAIEATECLVRRAIASAPADGRLYRLLASVEAATGRSADAAESCRRAIELGDDSPEVHAILGRAELEGLRFEEAVAAFRRALVLDEHSIEAVPAAGVTALAAAADDELKVSLEDHLQGHGTCTSSVRALALIARRDGDLEAALGYYERLVALDADDSAARYALAQLFRREGREEEGRQQVEAFGVLKEREDAEWLRRNDAFRRRVDAEGMRAARPLEAFGIYRGLAEEGLATVEDYVAAGRLLLDLGEPEGARQWFEQVLDREPYQAEALQGIVQSAVGAAESGAPSAILELARKRLDSIEWACASEPRAH